MKKFSKALAAVIALMLCLTIAFAACKKHEHEFSTEWTHDEINHWHAATCEHDEKQDVALHTLSNGVCSVCGYTYMSLSDYKSYSLNALETYYNAIGKLTSSTLTSAVNAAYASGKDSINAAGSVSEAQQALAAAKTAISKCIPLANGIYDFTGLDADGKTEILGLLEAYAVRTGLTGTTFYENGGYVMYNPCIKFGTETYIPGYGFGILTEGDITAPLDYESNAAWKYYYHDVNATDPGTANYLNDKGSEVADFYSYFGASYYTTVMNKTKDGYDWIPELALEDPVAVSELNASKQATTWKFKINTELKYNTNSSIESRKAFNNRKIDPQDFITAFKLLLNHDNGLYRGEEMTTQTGASKIVGADAYWKATDGKGKGIVSDSDVNFSETVHIKVYQDQQDWWFEFELGAPVNQYYARYYISSSLYMPVPEDFIKLVGVDNYLGFNSNKTETPVDNALSLGAYTLEQWDSGKQVVYKKNPNYVYADKYYSIKGVHTQILPAIETDTEAAFREFLAGHIDASGIPYTQLANYVNDPRTKSTTGNNCVKLNMNALDQETWEQLFGVNGTVAQTPRGEYWQVEPALSNANFRSGLSYALNRLDFAVNKGTVASLNFFSSNYMSDPENGIAYNSTEAHKKAISSLLKGTDDYGYSLQLARDYFKVALQELEASGAYKPGTPSNPTVINLQIAWQAAVQETSFHAFVKQYWEDAFNDPSVTRGLYKLNIEFWVGTIWSDVYYNKMMTGQFDIGFGSISGNSLDPLSFMNVLSSNQAISGNFTLNWGIDTNDPDADILVYNDMRWSYDALFMSSQEKTKVSQGKLVEYVAKDRGSYEFDDNRENLIATLVLDVAEGVKIDKTDFFLYGGYYSYGEFEINEFLDGGKPSVSNGKYTYKFVIPVSTLLEEFGSGTLEELYMNAGIDAYVAYSVEADGVQVDYDLENPYVKPFASYDLDIASSFGLTTFDDSDNENIVVTVRMRLAKGVSKDDISFYAFGMEDEELDDVFVDVTIVSIKDDGDGVYTFTLSISKAALAESKMSGETVKVGNKSYDLVDYQGVRAVFSLNADADLTTAEWSFELVQPKPAQQ